MIKAGLILHIFGEHFVIVIRTNCKLSHTAKGKRRGIRLRQCFPTIILQIKSACRDLGLNWYILFVCCKMICTLNHNFKLQKASQKYGLECTWCCVQLLIFMKSALNQLLPQIFDIISKISRVTSKYLPMCKLWHISVNKQILTIK